MDAEFVKKEAKWYKASLSYDNLSRLPPTTEEALETHYIKPTREGPVAVLKALDYLDPWPVFIRKVKTKKVNLKEQDDYITAGIPPEDREDFNKELQAFRQENCPSEIEDLPNPILVKTEKAQKAKRSAANRQKPTLEKDKSTMAPAQNTRNTRLRAKALTAATTAEIEVPKLLHIDMAPDATNTITAPVAAGHAERTRLQSAPPFMSLMRDTRTAVALNAIMSRPVRGVISNAYYSALNNGPRAKSIGDMPTGNNNLHVDSQGKELAGGHVAPSKTAVSKKPVITKKPLLPMKPAASKKPAVPKPAASKRAGSTKPVAIKPSSGKPLDGTPADAIVAAVKPQRAAKACDSCRKHKTRCTGGNPCVACHKRRFICVYDPDGRKAPLKRAHEENEEAVKKEHAQEVAEYDGRPAKRARKEPAAHTKANESADIPKENALSATRGREVSHVAEIQPAKRQRPTRLRVKKAPETIRGAIVGLAEMQSASGLVLETIKEAIAQPSKIQTFSQETPESTEKAGILPTKALSPCHEIPNDTGDVSIHSTKMQSSGRGLDERGLERTEEVKTQTTKSQGKGKRAREETEEVQDRPAKLQRKNDRQGDIRLLEAIDSVQRQHSTMDWEHNWEPTMMGHMFSKWQKSFDYPNIDLRTQDESFHSRPSIKLVMTDVLKGVLVDDWEHVTKDSQLVPLPHAHPVDQILNDYLEDEMTKREEDSAQMDILNETVAGLREYFDRALGRILLYRFERLQHSELSPRWEGKQEGPSTTYGGEHLCRLLVSLPELLAQTNMDQQSVSRLREELTKFTNWLSKNANKYFVREYEDPGAEYIEKAKNS